MGSSGSPDYTNGDYVNVHHNNSNYSNGRAVSSSLDHTTDSLELGREQLELWQEIYKLGVSGVDKYIELPQIVVVGDQSSGKSSVLEAMTGVPFPRGSGMCTKFPTQIKLRKAEEKGFFASLIPDVNRSSTDKERFARFTEKVHGETDLAVILKLAEKTIWPHDNASNLPSKDILNLEFSGPKKPYLTVVDLPGIIHVPTGDQTKADLAAIKELAIDSMKNARTIILAVVSAQNDISNQEVLDMARQVDPSGNRTLGIITKPDRSESTENTDLFLKLALNQTVKLDLGWHVLRNRSSDEKNWSSEERDANEKEFFQTSRWKVLDRKDVGIDSLLSKVSKLLLRRFAEVVPHVVSEIERKLEQCKKELEALGEGSGTVQQMRAKLANWCKVSKDYVYNAAEGYYRDHYKNPFFDSENGDGHRRKLRARIDIENERFEQDLRNFGHTVEIIHGRSASNNDDSFVVEGVNRPWKMTRADFIANNIEPVLLESTGKELRGDSNPLLVYKMFEKQSRNWDKLAARHMMAIERICEEFLYEVLDSVWPGILQDRIWSAFIEEPLEGRRDDANGEVERLCRDRSRYAKSYDQEFLEGVKRWEAKFQAVESDSSDESTNNTHTISLGERSLAKMLAYYEVTSKVFISNVIVQVVERHLIDNLEDIFDGPNVQEMPEEKVKEIFEEDERTRSDRTKLQAERTSLEIGLKSARKLAARKELKVYDRKQPEPRLSNARASTRGAQASSREPPQTPQPRRRKQGTPLTPMSEEKSYTDRPRDQETFHPTIEQPRPSTQDPYYATTSTDPAAPPVPPYLPQRPQPQTATSNTSAYAQTPVVERVPQPYGSVPQRNVSRTAQASSTPSYAPPVPPAPPGAFPAAQAQSPGYAQNPYRGSREGR